ncbi:hypothetical protein CDD83_8578 [Cordyceps sp. RAO-2017]|nr:hypothetical protein CDD83_8578 [Cordyceps sp. RAO-2017]
MLATLRNGRAIFSASLACRSAVALRTAKTSAAKAVTEEDAAPKRRLKKEGAALKKQLEKEDAAPKRRLKKEDVAPKRRLKKEDAAPKRRLKKEDAAPEEELPKEEGDAPKRRPKKKDAATKKEPLKEEGDPPKKRLKKDDAAPKKRLKKEDTALKKKKKLLEEEEDAQQKRLKKEDAATKRRLRREEAALKKKLLKEEGDALMKQLTQPGDAPEIKPTTPSTPLAHQITELLETKGKRRGNLRKTTDVATGLRRVNIISSELCDDIIGYFGTSLERHRGCDLVDLNPGIGLWSRKLHDLLQPRKHIMMEPDAEVYRPLFQDLASRKNVEVIPQSGFVWKHLLEALSTHLSNQREMEPGATPERNDTLLVTANLSTYPRTLFQERDTFSTMAAYQLMATIRTRSLFQRYGLVRMLIWVNDEEKRKFLPRTITRRRRGSFEAELSCEWIHEVAGLDGSEGDKNALRDAWMNAESGYMTMTRMAERGLTVPAGRETREHAALRAKPAFMGQRLAGVQPPFFTRPMKREIEQLKTDCDSSDFSTAMRRRLQELTTRDKLFETGNLNFLDLLQQYEAATRLATNGSPKFAAAEAKWNERVDSLKKGRHNEFLTLLDNYRLFRQDTPVMLWDRREYEPLAVRAEEFFPAAPTALLDLQPKAMHPLLRGYGASSSHSGGISETLLRFWFHMTVMSVEKAMDTVWAGFSDAASQCPSLRDVTGGGSPLTGTGALTARAINEQQWIELLQAWMDWPFRPSYASTLGRLEDSGGEGEEEDGKSGAAGMML